MKLFVVIFVALFAYTSGVPLSQFEARIFKDLDKFSTSRIVGGSDAKRHEYPHQISFLYQTGLGFSHICGGAILSPTIVITAGHCIIDTNPNEFQVKAGILNEGEDHPDIQTVGVAHISVHPKYPGGVAPNDLALVTLQRPLTWTNAVKPIKLPKDNTYPKGKTQLSGWGYLSSYPPHNPPSPTTLQHITLPIISLEDCAAALDHVIGRHEPLDTSMVCTGPLSGGLSPCNGDSGGALIQNGELVGIVSWGINPCGTRGAPAVFTNPGAHLEFIKQHVPDL